MSQKAYRLYNRYRSMEKDERVWLASVAALGAAIGTTVGLTAGMIFVIVGIFATLFNSRKRSKDNESAG
jgi:hypothetical protein